MEAGERIEIPIEFFDEEDATDNDGWEDLPEFDAEEEKRKSDQEDHAIDAGIKRKEK